MVVHIWKSDESRPNYMAEKCVKREHSTCLSSTVFTAVTMVEKKNMGPFEMMHISSCTMRI